MKKWLVVLCAVMLIAALMSTAAAEDRTDFGPGEYDSWDHSSVVPLECGDYKYIVLKDGTAEIVEYTGSDTEVTIPATLNDLQVTSIGYEAFYHCYIVTSINIPNGVTAIGIDAFRTCPSLSSITIPPSVTFIGDGAFANCEALTSITIPDSVIEIGINPFAGCELLTEINVSSTHPMLTLIDGVLFDKTEKRLICYPCGLTATEYSIPEGTLRTGIAAFYGNETLTSIIIPDSITFIEEGAFQGCLSVTSISIPDSVTAIGHSAFHMCSSLPSLTIPDNVTSIGETAFWNCYNLISVNIPDSVTEMNDIFFGCSNLTDIKVSSTHPKFTTINGVLFNKEETELLCYPGGLTASEYVVPDGTVILGEYGFNSNESLVSVIIPDSVTTIEMGVFSDCRSLTNIVIPDSVTTIENYAFSSCRNLTSIVIPTSVTSISSRLFSFCDSLTNIIIPASVTSIGNNSFFYCDSLTNLTIPASVTFIGENAFADCPNLILAVIPDSYAEQYAVDNEIPYTYFIPEGFWLCACGSLNDYNFCPDCGSANPNPEPQCQNCGYDPEGETPNFCPACGTRF